MKCILIKKGNFNIPNIMKFSKRIFDSECNLLKSDEWDVMFMFNIWNASI